MEPWEKALGKFLVPWKTKKGIVGAIVAGSRTTSYFSKYSDIDVNIITTKNARRERGSRIVDGFMIEYFVNPPDKIRAYFRYGFSDNNLIIARIFAMGRIIFDNGDVKKLKKAALNLMKRKFKKMPSRDKKASKYTALLNLDDLKGLYEKKSGNFDYFYFFCLERIINNYTKFMRCENPFPSKLLGFLENRKFRNEYMMEEFPDREFKKLLREALVTKSRKDKMRIMERITSHVTGKMGGIDIDGWKLYNRRLNLMPFNLKL